MDQDNLNKDNNVNEPEVIVSAIGAPITQSSILAATVKNEDIIEEEQRKEAAETKEDETSTVNLRMFLLLTLGIFSIGVSIFFSIRNEENYIINPTLALADDNETIEDKQDEIEENIKVDSMTMEGCENGEINLYIEDYKKVSASFHPDTATNKNTFWRTSNENVAKISNKIITGSSIGSATIEVVLSSDIDVKASCKVNVIEYDKNEKINKETKPTCAYDINEVQIPGTRDYNKFISTLELDSWDTAQVHATRCESLANVIEGAVSVIREQGNTCWGKKKTAEFVHEIRDKYTNPENKDYEEYKAKVLAQWASRNCPESRTYTLD